MKHTLETFKLSVEYYLEEKNSILFGWLYAIATFANKLFLAAENFTQQILLGRLNDFETDTQ